MPPAHVAWLEKAGGFKTVDGTTVEVWELNHKADEKVLSEWAKHFRQHYCDDAMLPELVKGTGKTKAQFLRDIKFPSTAKGTGPATRSGDFGEILVADYLEFIQGYWCPREHRYMERKNPDVPDPGTDVIGFKLVGKKESQKDELLLLESKSGLTPTKENRLQIAINDSAKDQLREPIALNAIKQRFLREDKAKALRIERFQNEADRPFTRLSQAAVVVDDAVIGAMKLQNADASKHPNKANLSLIVIKGSEMKNLVNALYERAADEA